MPKDFGAVSRSEDLTPQDAAVLKQYSGKGGLTENSQYEYYTPPFVAEGVWDALKEHGFENGNVLEPSAGAGVFGNTKPRGTLLSGAEIDATSSKINQLLHPEDKIENKSFEQLCIESPDESFDAIVGNVPFGSARGEYQHQDPDYKNEKRIERYFLLRAVTKVKPGGLICLVVPTNIVGNRGDEWERFRQVLSLKAEFLGAHKLPSKTFAQQGTNTVVDIIVLKKHPKDLLIKVEDLPLDILVQSNVLWTEFIEGRYWQGEGKPFIMGKYIPKDVANRFSHEEVQSDLDNIGIKKALSKNSNLVLIGMF